MTNLVTKSGSTTLQDATYSYSPGGLLKGRLDTQAPGGALNETFQYDALNRLRWWCVKDVPDGSNECAQSQFGVGYAFTDNGNMTERRTFANGAKNSPLEQIAFTYPTAGSPQAHAVKQRTWAQGAGTGAGFSYDNAGRQWKRPDQTLTYNSNHLPEKIVAGSATTTYLYGDGGSRYQKKTVVSANLTRTTTYAAGLYELREETGTAAAQPKTHVYYITLGNTVLAQLTRTEPNLLSLDAEYLHNDHIGTVSFSTSSAGVVSNKVRTDPYGNKFDPTKAPRLDQPIVPGVANVTRGFTGHEMEVDDLGVINMGGRIFDPVNARFNSPDPLVQAPQYGQSYNRYLYVMGNPLGFVDPTGYSSDYVDYTRYGYNGAESYRMNNTDLYMQRDPALEASLEEMHAMSRESMDEAQAKQEKQELVQEIQAKGNLSEGAATAIVNAHAQLAAQGLTGGSFVVVGVQPSQMAETQGGRQATSTSGLLAANESNNSKTATDAGKGYGDGGQNGSRSSRREGELPDVEPKVFAPAGGTVGRGHPLFQLTDSAREALSPLFPGTDISKARFVFDRSIDQSETRGNVVRLSGNDFMDRGADSRLDSLLHELVHVGQYQAMGELGMFVWGVFRGKAYDAPASLAAIPLGKLNIVDTRFSPEAIAQQFADLAARTSIGRDNPFR